MPHESAGVPFSGSRTGRHFSGTELVMPVVTQIAGRTSTLGKCRGADEQRSESYASTVCLLPRD